MVKHLIVEEKNLAKPILLLVDTSTGEYNPLLNLLVESFYEEVRSYVLSPKKISLKASKISPLGIHMLERIRDEISYALLFLDSEKQKKEVLEAVLKLETRNTKTLILIPARKKNDYLDVYLELKQKKNVSVVFVGDIFGRQLKSTKLSRQISECLTTHYIEVENSGLTPLYPISDEDLVNGLKHILLGVKAPALLYNAYYKDPQTQLSFAHHLKNVEPELSLRFVNSKEKVAESFAMSEQSIYERVGVKPEYIKTVLGFNRSAEKMPVLEEKEVKQVRKKNRRIGGKTFVAVVKRTIIVVCIAFVLYAIVSAASIGSSVFFLNRSVKALSTGNFGKSVSDMRLSNTLYLTASPTFFALDSIPNVPMFSDIKQSASLYSEVQDVLPDVSNILQKVVQSQTLTQADVEEIKIILSKFYFLTQNSNLLQGANDTFIKDLTKNSDMLILLPHISEALGFLTPKSYVLLFQNSNELRPTGGFIGSVGYLTLDKGNVQSLIIEDVYDVDGQLRGHIEPHYIIRRFLQPSLYLRDSNFNPDFEYSATQSAFMYNLVSDRSVDGIIAVDTYVLKQLIEIAGPIDLASLDNELTGENAANIIHNSIHDDYFEGSTEKKQILGELASKLTSVFEKDTSKQLALVKALPDLMRSKHILFSFPQTSFQNAFSNLGFTGSLKDKRLSSYDIPDILSINEANIGVNKANANITRRVSYKALLEGSTLFSDASLTLENSGEESYKTYVRYIIPKNAEVTSIIINGQQQQIVPAVVSPIQFERSAFVPPAGLEVDEEVQDSYKMVGFVTEIKAYTGSSIHMLYKNEYDTSNSTLDYSLLYIKQPGTDKYPLLVELNTNGGYKLPTNVSNVLLNTEIQGDVVVDEVILKTR